MEKEQNLTANLDNQDSLNPMRHSLAHLLAAAVLDLYPEAKPSIGPAIENGFYYDFEFKEPISDSDLPAIEKKMRSLLPLWKEWAHKEISADESKKYFKENNYKLELIDEITTRGSQSGEKITLYTCGGFTDLCRGGHVPNPSKDIDPTGFKLTHTAGAYWRGDEKNKMLTRIYGLAFKNGKELKAYLEAVEEAKKRDHRKLGKELKLFTVIDEIGPGLPLFYPNGAMLRRVVENYIIEEQEKRGYEPIWIPHITKGELYKISGHLDKYDAMYPPMDVDKEHYYLKPMNCPHFMMLYKSLPHSYRELPVRYTCTTTNYRYEKSGELSGLTRVRSLTQDDCHVFTDEKHIESEIELMLDMIKTVYAAFGFNDFYVRLSLRDSKNKQKYIGSDAIWDKAENALRTVVKKTGWRSVEAEDEAAFYGPKLDFMMKDVLRREWQLSTIQLDFNMPERFDLDYVDSTGKKERPIVIHRAILGSTERFLGILIEHFGGAFPLWLSPVQIRVIPVSIEEKAVIDFAKTITETLKSAGLRTELEMSDEGFGKKVRQAKVDKIPYFIVVGKKEVESQKITLENRSGAKEANVSIEEILVKLLEEVSKKK